MQAVTAETGMLIYISLPPPSFSCSSFASLCTLPPQSLIASYFSSSLPLHPDLLSSEASTRHVLFPLFCLHLTWKLDPTPVATEPRGRKHNHLFICFTFAPNCSLFLLAFSLLLFVLPSLPLSYTLWLGRSFYFLCSSPDVYCLCDYWMSLVIGWGLISWSKWSLCVIVASASRLFLSVSAKRVRNIMPHNFYGL